MRKLLKLQAPRQKSAHLGGICDKPDKCKTSQQLIPAPLRPFSKGVTVVGAAAAHTTIYQVVWTAKKPVVFGCCQQGAHLVKNPGIY